MQSTLVALEWAKVAQLVASFAKTSAGQEEVLRTVPEFGAASWKAYHVSRDLAALVARVGPLDFSGLEALPLLKAASLTGKPQELSQLVRLARTIAEVRRTIAAFDSGPALAELAQGLPQLDSFLAWCEQRLDGEGHIPDSASPVLAQLRSSREHLKASLRQQLEALARQLPFASGPYTLRRDRFCFPVPASERWRVPGLVLDASGSGATVFLEPFPLVEPNNSLAQLESQIREEEERILREITAGFFQRRSELLAACEVLTKLDAFQARVLYGKATGGVLLPPGGGKTLRVIGARHPLLDPALAPLRAQVLGEAGNRQSVVPTSLEFPSQVRLILVSGPNAGGKTVALKTVGLLALMAAAGIPVLAAQETVLPPLSGVFCHIGDEQNLLGELSTFQAAMKATARLLAEDDQALLVLYDEIGSGTDPEEGQALAAALLEELARRGWWTLATSHLTTLAAHVESISGAANAAMGFDEATGRPTYHLILGRPGSSRGLALARSCGLPPKVLERAESLLSRGSLTLASYLARLDEQSRELAKAQASLAEAERRLRAAELAASQQAKNLEAKQNELRAQLHQELTKLRQQAQQRWTEVVRELELAKQKGSHLGRRRLASLRAHALDIDLPHPPSQAAPAELAPGDAVQVHGLDSRGQVLRLRGEQAEVAIGGKRIWVPRSDCTRVESPAPQAKLAIEATSAPVELVLVGLDREAARERLEKFLDSALVNGYRYLRIVHGHGTGTLRRLVWEVLKAFPAVASMSHPPQFRGGTGVTEVELEG